MRRERRQPRPAEPAPALATCRLVAAHTTANGASATARIRNESGIPAFPGDRERRRHTATENGERCPRGYREEHAPEWQTGPSNRGVDNDFSCVDAYEQ